MSCYKNFEECVLNQYSCSQHRKPSQMLPKYVCGWTKYPSTTSKNSNQPGCTNLDAGIDDDVFGSVAVVVLLAMGIVQVVVEVCSLFASFFAAAALWCQRGCFCYRCVALLFIFNLFPCQCASKKYSHRILPFCPGGISLALHWQLLLDCCCFFSRIVGWLLLLIFYLFSPVRLKIFSHIILLPGWHCISIVLARKHFKKKKKK